VGLSESNTQVLYITSRRNERKEIFLEDGDWEISRRG
jgi:hypothetical protein